MTRSVLADPTVVIADGNALAFGLIINETLQADGSTTVEYLESSHQQATATVPAGAQFIYGLCGLLLTPENNYRLTVYCPVRGIGADSGHSTEMVKSSQLTLPNDLELDTRVQVYGDLLYIRFEFAGSDQPDHGTLERYIRSAVRYYVELMSAAMGSRPTLIIGLARYDDSLPTITPFAISAD